MAENWNWHDNENKELIVVPQVEALAIYENPDMNIVMRQQDFMGEEDQVIVIPKSHLKSVIKRLQDLAKNS